jgi:hypothetical protein
LKIRRELRRRVVEELERRSGAASGRGSSHLKDFMALLAQAEAQRGHDAPDRKVVAMLDARRLCLPAPAAEGRGKTVANRKRKRTETY